MLSRRELIGKAAVGATAALTVTAALKGVASARTTGAHTDDHDAQKAAPPADESAAATAPAPWQLVSPLVAGSAIANGWRLTDLSDVRNGSCVVTVTNERGRSHRIHVCRNDGEPHGIVHTRGIDFVVMNEGYGDLPTDEGLAHAIARLAHTVAANEPKVSRDCLAGLLPHAERVRRFASAQGQLSDGKLR
jgi:hypothetical protein